MAGEFDDIRQRLESSARSWPTWPSCGCASRSTPAATSCPVDERRLTRARRAVEKAIGILREADDRDDRTTGRLRLSSVIRLIRSGQARPLSRSIRRRRRL